MLHFSVINMIRLDSLTDLQPFTPTIEEILLLVLDCLSALTMSCNKSIVEITWAPVLETITLIIDRVEDDEVVMAILKIYEGYVKCACESNLVTARDAFLTSVCKYVSKCVLN
jgi:hypothetical protein